MDFYIKIIFLIAAIKSCIACDQVTTNNDEFEASVNKRSGIALSQKEEEEVNKFIEKFNTVPISSHPKIVKAKKVVDARKLVNQVKTGRKNNFSDPIAHQFFPEKKNYP